MNPITVPIRPSSTRLFATCRIGAIRVVSLRRRLDASSARLSAAHAAMLEVGWCARPRDSGEPLQLVQAAAELDRLLPAPHQPDQEYGGDRPAQAAFVGRDNLADPTLTRGGADQCQGDRVGQDEPQQQQIAVGDRIFAGNGPPEFGEQTPQRGLGVLGAARGQLIVGNARDPFIVASSKGLKSVAVIAAPRFAPRAPSRRRLRGGRPVGNAQPFASRQAPSAPLLQRFAKVALIGAIAASCQAKS